MKISGAIAVATMVAAAFLAGSASAQKSKVALTQMFFDNSYEWSLPGDGKTTLLELTGLKTAHAAWLRFAKFQNGAVARDPQVITLMEGVTVKWGEPMSCVYELRLVASPPAITMTKSSGACALSRPGDMALFGVLAM